MSYDRGLHQFKAQDGAMCQQQAYIRNDYVIASS